MSSVAFFVRKRENPSTGDREWCFMFNNQVLGIGDGNQRYFPTKDELIATLEGLDIKPDRYEVQA